MMKIDRTISFRQDMIDLILAGKKTVTIRPIKPQPEVKQDYAADMMLYLEWNGYNVSAKEPEWILKQYPHGKIGDIVAIRERPDVKLKITNIRVMMLQDIPNEIWWKESIDDSGFAVFSKLLWKSFYENTEYVWSNNPFVWIIEFELIRKGQEDDL